MERMKRSPNSSIMRSTSDSLLKRTSSSVNVAVAKSDLYLKDDKNIDTADDQHTVRFNENESKLEHGENCDILLNKIALTEEREIKTTDLLTNETFIVKADMLLHKGKKYTFDDIAPKWKKDCRTWLWKNKVSKICSAIDELQKNFESVGI